MASIREIRLGIVGSGGMAHHRAERFSQTEPYRLVAVASRNAETGAALASRYDMEYVPEWQALVQRPDIDAVVICTHNDSHGEIAVASLEAGKHVFSEYPLARQLEQGRRAVQLARQTGRVLRLTHSEPVSRMHARLRQIVSEHGPMCVATFTRLTPGRGARPEILFNLNISGPPALFFIYHIYPVIDLFGPVEWVEGAAWYEGLKSDGSYHRFVNTVHVKFRSGGLGQWMWAGGIEIQEAEEYRRYVLTGGTLIQEHGEWRFSTRSGVTVLQPVETRFPSLETLFCKDIAGEATNWQHDAALALRAIQVSLAAERSMKENRRIFIESEEIP